MCHGTIGFTLIKIQSQPYQNYGTLWIPDGVLIEIDASTPMHPFLTWNGSVAIVVRNVMFKSNQVVRWANCYVNNALKERVDLNITTGPV